MIVTKYIEKNITIILALSVITLTFTGCAETGRTTPPQAIGGVIDLRDWDFTRDGPLDLAGEWEFYWEQCYGATDPGLGMNIQPDGMFDVPAMWEEGYGLPNGRPISPYGYATLRLRVLLPETSPSAPTEPLWIYVKHALTAYDLRVFGGSKTSVVWSILSRSRFTHSRDRALYSPMVFGAVWVETGTSDRDSELLHGYPDICTLHPQHVSRTGNGKVCGQICLGDYGYRHRLFAISMRHARNGVFQNTRFLHDCDLGRHRVGILHSLFKTSFKNKTSLTQSRYWSETPAVQYRVTSP